MPTAQLPDGSEVDTTSVDFEHVSEPWGEYELEDGTTLKIRTVVTNIQRVDAEDNPQGNQPLYNVNSETLVRASEIPEDLIEEDSRSIEPGLE